MTCVLGSSHGRLWQRQNLNALPHFVCLVPLFRFLSSLPSFSSNLPASLTARLGATIDVEQNRVRFLGDLILNLWDCGGQDAFMDSYLSSQRPTIFQQVGVLIYVFDVETQEKSKDLEYYRDCIDGLRQYSPDASVFLLIHKMDLVRDKQGTFEKKMRELEDVTGDLHVSVFGTSIYDESLYKVCVQASLSPCSRAQHSKGMVTHRPYAYSQCRRASQTSVHLCQSLQCHRSHPIRARHISRHRHLFLSISTHPRHRTSRRGRQGWRSGP